MPRDKDLKRLVRRRMQKTGESYTTARARLRAKTPTRRSTPEPTPAAPPPLPEPPVDYAAIGGMSDDTMLSKTGRTWEQWVHALDSHDASGRSHTEIARIVQEQYDVPGWWSQCVAVGYERIRGLRVKGQRRDGSYEASKSRTFNVPIAVLFDAWLDPKKRRRWLKVDGVKVRSSVANKSMRLGWPDGAIIGLFFTARGDSKCAVSVQHTKLPDKETAERLKQEWSGRLDELAKMLKV